MSTIASVGASPTAAAAPAAADSQLSVAAGITRSVAAADALQSSTGETLAKVLGSGDANVLDLQKLHMQTSALQVMVATASALIDANKDDLKRLAGKI